MFSNYSVKKILPRLIIVAIAVNLSFYICAALVDVSNILGASLRGFVTDLGPNEMYENNIGNNVAEMITGTAFAGAVAIGIIILVLCNIGVVAAGILLLLAVLALRDVLVTVLIIISPIAFVLYLLPNTEKWFKKWLNEFARCLFVYPAIGFVWGSTSLLTGVILTSNNTIMGFVMACMVQLVPVVAVIPIMKMGGQALGGLQKLAEKGIGATGVKEIGNDLGHAGKTAGFNALRGKIMSGKNYQKDEDGKYTYAKGRKAGQAVSEGLQARLEGRAAKGKDVSNNIARRIFGGAAGKMAGLGEGNTKDLASTLRQGEKALTSGAIRNQTKGENLKAKLSVNPQQLQAEIGRSKYKVDLEEKNKDNIVNRNAYLAAMKAKSESGEQSIKFQSATEALNVAKGMNLDVGARAGLAAERDRQQDVLTQEQMSGISNFARTMDGQTLNLNQQAELMKKGSVAGVELNEETQKMVSGMSAEQKQRNELAIYNKQIEQAEESKVIESIRKNIEGMSNLPSELQATHQQSLADAEKKGIIVSQREQAIGINKNTNSSP